MTEEQIIKRAKRAKNHEGWTSTRNGPTVSMYPRVNFWWLAVWAFVLFLTLVSKHVASHTHWIFAGILLLATLWTLTGLRGYLAWRWRNRLVKRPDLRVVYKRECGPEIVEAEEQRVTALVAAKERAEVLAYLNGKDGK